MTMRLRLTGTFVLVFGIFVFAGSALAGNGNGNENGNGSSGAPGNSASAPGQVKKDAPPAGAETTTVATTTVADQNAAPTAGVKPANDTAHDTRAPASSSATKLYGNGQTAGGIALHHGASPSTRLHGPGNSQPHKAAPCSGGHEVDVHALKGRRTGACGSTPPTPRTPAPGTETEHKPSTPTNADPSAGHQSGDAAAVTASHSRKAGAAQVLATTGRAAELPFTGERLWIAVLAGLVLIGTGLALRQNRTQEAAVQSGHDDTDRSRRPARDVRASVGGRSGR